MWPLLRKRNNEQTKFKRKITRSSLEIASLRHLCTSHGDDPLAIRGTRVTLRIKVWASGDRDFGNICMQKVGAMEKAIQIVSYLGMYYNTCKYLKKKKVEVCDCGFLL